MVHMNMVLRIWSSYFNHRSRGNQNDTGSGIETSQISSNWISGYQSFCDV